MNANAVPQITFGDLIKQHLDSMQTAGQDWPFEAIYAMVYSCSTWPCGYGEPMVKFFNKQQDLDAWLARQREWAKLEDNYWRGTLYEWDWGPVLVRMYD